MQTLELVKQSAEATLASTGASPSAIDTSLTSTTSSAVVTGASAGIVTTPWTRLTRPHNG